jgi:hypothetical protein
MKNIDSTYVAIGASWLLVGMILGIIMGATNNFQFMPLHAHINLIGSQSSGWLTGSGRR